MSDPVIKYRPDADGIPRSEGVYAVSAAGNVFIVPPGQPIKPGVRLATFAEVEAVHGAPATPEHADEPAHDEPAHEDHGE